MSYEVMRDILAVIADPKKATKRLEDIEVAEKRVLSADAEVNEKVAQAKLALDEANAATAKLKTDAEQLEKLAADTRERIERMNAQLNELADKREADKAEFTRREKALSDRETELKAKTSELDKREAEMARREEDFDRKQKEIAVRVARFAETIG